MASRPPIKARSVFVDASVLIAAALSATGRARDLLLAAFGGRLDVYISDFALDETKRNLQRKAPATLPQFQFLASAFPAVVTAPEPLVLEVAKVIELKDAPIVAGQSEPRPHTWQATRSWNTSASSSPLRTRS